MIVFLCISGISNAQDTIRQKVSDTSFLSGIATQSPTSDSVFTVTLPTDSISTDSITKQEKKTALKSKVEYASKDSLRFDIKNQKVFLYKEADIKYEDISLKSGYVEIDFPKTLVYAKGIPDSTGKESELPEFTQTGQSFKSRVINYNYDTKQGYIQKVITKQDEGYLHGQVVKKMENNVTYISDGSYTTCEHPEHPHFGFKFNKAKVIPGKKVITGPAYMTIAEVPTPLMIPFGFFPNKSGQRSGILVPTYGESNNRGFYFENLGYYWAINDYMDLKVQGDIFTHGSWAIKPTYTYNYRYHFSGMLNFSYALNKIGTQDSPDYEESRDYRIRWMHTQDPRSRPHSTFSANVNIVSSTFNKYNLASSAEAYLSNTFQSSINYSTNWKGKYYLNLNFNHSQNTINHTVNISFPQVAFSVNQFYPLRRKTRVGKIRWYENISTKYNLDIQNQYNTYDSLLFKPGWEREMKNGIRHSIPISSTIRILKYINWSNGININDRMYYQTIRKSFISDTADGFYRTDTVYGFQNAFDANFSSSINTRLYGMYQFKKGPIMAIRHMMTPTVGFSYTPDWGAEWLGYWRYIENDADTVNPQRYSIFQNGIYGSPPPNKAGVLNFGLSNNLEMKVRNRKDTVTGSRKVMLIEDLTIRASYDISKDSVKWSKVTISGYTTLFKTLRITYASSLDPYARNSRGARINVSEWKMNHRLLRLDNTSWDVGINYNLTSEKVKGNKKPTKGSEREKQDVMEYYDYYVDFDIPWSFGFSYNFRYNKDWITTNNKREGKIIQTLSFNGQLNITPKWKITLMSGYDFTTKQISYTSIEIYRDLHCWQMSFGWIPKGAQQSWNFSINVKASVLQDMKLNKKKDFRDFSD